MTSPPFRYARATSADDATTKAARNGAAFLAGGTDLLQLWKCGVMAPAACCANTLCNPPAGMLISVTICTMVVKTPYSALPMFLAIG